MIIGQDNTFRFSQPSVEKDKSEAKASVFYRRTRSYSVSRPTPHNTLRPVVSEALLGWDFAQKERAIGKLLSQGRDGDMEKEDCYKTLTVHTYMCVGWCAGCYCSNVPPPFSFHGQRPDG